jgi:hypothetical protein
MTTPLEEEVIAACMDGSRSTLIVETPSMNLLTLSVALEYNKKEGTKSLQLRLIEFPGSKVCNL